MFLKVFTFKCCAVKMTSKLSDWSSAILCRKLCNFYVNTIGSNTAFNNDVLFTNVCILVITVAVSYTHLFHHEWQNGMNTIEAGTHFLDQQLSSDLWSTLNPHMGKAKGSTLGHRVYLSLIHI